MMQTRFDTEKKDKENELLKKNLEIEELSGRRQQAVIYSVSFVALSMLALAFFIYRGLQQKKRANAEILLQKQIIEAKNEAITDSIHYARRIQQSLLPTEKYIQRSLDRLTKR